MGDLGKIVDKVREKASRVNAHNKSVWEKMEQIDLKINELKIQQAQLQDEIDSQLIQKNVWAGKLKGESVRDYSLTLSDQEIKSLVLGEIGECKVSEGENGNEIFVQNGDEKIRVTLKPGSVYARELEITNRGKYLLVHMDASETKRNREVLHQIRLYRHLVTGDSFITNFVGERQNLNFFENGRVHFGEALHKMLECSSSQ